MASRLCLIDGSGFIFRAFHALPPLTTPSGVPIGAVVGFCNMILKLQEDRCPQHWAMVFDTGQPTFRHHLFPAYKANRSVPAPELITQFSLIREVCRTMRIPIIEEVGMEADDIIATYACAAHKKGWDVEIVSSDKDLMQLVQQGLILFDPLKNKVWDEAAVTERWGVPPEKIVDVQALIGDPTDNITGIPGVGIKTAVAWIQRFGSIRGLLENYETLEQPKKRELIEEHKKDLPLYQQLVTLKTDVAMPLSLEDLPCVCPDNTLLEMFLTKHGMDAIKARLIRKGVLHKKKAVLSLVPDCPLSEVVRLAHDKGWVSLYPVFESASLVGLGWSVAGSAGFSPIDMGDLEGLHTLLKAPYILKIVHDAKALMHLFAPGTVVAFEDVMLLSYLTRGGQGEHTLPAIAAHEGYEESIETPQEGAYALAVLYQQLKKKVEEQSLVTVYETLEKPCVPVLTEMERFGIMIDPQRLKAIREDLDMKMAAIEKDIYEEIGHEVNLASPKQVGEVLFEELAFKGGVKGKSGQYNTSSAVLEDLKEEGYGLADKILAWRQVSKLRSTYTDALLERTNPETGRVSTHYSMVTTSTGRLSSLSPNLQNIPIRTPEGRKIRATFHAAPGYRLISLDYSQIELRLLAHMADLKELKDAFLAKEDIHQKTAAKLFACALLDVSSEMRRKAKIINFGILYGMGPQGLARQMGVSEEEARGHIRGYFEAYPGIEAFLESTKEEARKNGYVTTLWGRRCAVPMILSQNYTVRGAAERQAINAPLQGTAADIIKRAMVHLARFLKDQPARLLLQIHDEVIIEAREDVVSDFIPFLQNIMEGAATLSVPLEVNASHGFYWGENTL